MARRSYEFDDADWYFIVDALLEKRQRCLGQALPTINTERARLMSGRARDLAIKIAAGVYEQPVESSLEDTQVIPCPPKSSSTS